MSAVNAPPLLSPNPATHVAVKDISPAIALKPEVALAVVHKLAGATQARMPMVVVVVVDHLPENAIAAVGKVT